MNITLIGMPGAGKSTLGVILAKTLLMDFIDTDIIIQNKTGRSLCEIINTEGRERFIKLENEIISHIKFENTVIATGGSAVYGKEAMEKLKSDSVIIYLKLPLDELQRRIKNIKTRGIVMQAGQTLQDVYALRAPLYEVYADIIIDCSAKSIEENVQQVINEIQAREEML